MIWLKKLKTIAFMFAAFGFLFTAALGSCGNKKTEAEAAEKTEHPEGASEHPEEAEHPTDSAAGEHPDN